MKTWYAMFTCRNGHVSIVGPLSEAAAQAAADTAIKFAHGDLVLQKVCNADEGSPEPLNFVRFDEPSGALIFKSKSGMEIPIVPPPPKPWDVVKAVAYSVEE